MSRSLLVHAIIWLIILAFILLLAFLFPKKAKTTQLRYQTTEQILHTPKKQAITLQTLFPPPQILKKVSTADFAKTTTTPIPKGNNSKILPSQPPSAAVPTPQNVVKQTTPGVLSEAAISYLGKCESGMDPAKNTGNGYYGAFQFSAGTWNSMGTGYARADLAPLDVQIAAVQRLVARSSVYSQFPGCSSKMRSNGIIS